MVENEELFRLLVEAVQDYAIYAVDLKGTILTWNKGAENLKGYTEEEIIGSNFSRFYTPEDIASHHPEENLEFALRHGSFEEEGWRVRKNGQRFWAEVLMTAIKDQHGETIGFSKITRDLTEKKAIEKRAQLEAVVQAMNDGVIVFDHRGEVVFVNEAQATICGYSTAKEMKRDLDYFASVFELKTPDGNHLPVSNWPISRVMRGESVHNVELFGRRSDTRQEWIFSFNGEPIRNIRGEQTLSLVITRDITREKNAEASLKESENQFRTFANSLPQLCWTANPEGVINWYNHQWYQYTGTTPSEMEGPNAQKVHHPDELPRVLEEWKKSIQTGETFEMEIPLRGADGAYRWFLTRATAVKNSNGQVTRWCGTNTDIDEQKKTRERERFVTTATDIFSKSLDYQETLQSLVNLIVNSMGNFSVITVVEPPNQLRIAAFAHTQPEMEGVLKKFIEQYPPQWDSPSGIGKAISTGTPLLYRSTQEILVKTYLRDANHRKTFNHLEMKSCMCVPITARGKTLGGISIISTDETHQYTESDLEVAAEVGKRAGIALDNAILYQQAQQAIRVRDEFMSIASHELKTPLTTLKLQVQIRQRKLEKGDFSHFTPEKITKMVADDDRQITRLTRLVEDILDVSRMGLGKLALNPEIMDLREMAQEVIERLSAQFQFAGTMVTLEAPEPVVGVWDHFRTEQILINLLSNAMKYGPNRPVVIQVLQTEKEAELSVIDQGIGIDLKDQERIFLQFERAVPSTGVSGLGLGLFIVRQLVEAHGGTIQLKSQLGEGSTFTVRLPKTLSRKATS